MSPQFTPPGGACNKSTLSHLTLSWLSGDLISCLKRWAGLKDRVDPRISSIHVQIWLASTVEHDLSLRYYRATFSIRNGVKWLMWDTGKIGEASDAGELSCLKQGWWNISAMEVALKNTRTSKKGCREPLRLVKLTKLWRLPQVLERANSTIGERCSEFQFHVTTWIGATKRRIKPNSNLTPDDKKKAGRKWSWNLRPRLPNYDLAVAFIGNGLEIWGHVRQVTIWSWHHRVKKVKEKLALKVQVLQL